MGRPSLKWRDVDRYFQKRGYEIVGAGGDKIIIAPKDGSGKRTRQTVRIGHKCCSQGGDEVWGCYVSKLRNVFGVSPEDIINDK